MNPYILTISLSVIGIITYLVVMKLLNEKNTSKRKMLSNILNEREAQGNNDVRVWLEKKGILKIISPVFIMEQSEKYGKKMSKQTYIAVFLLGAVLGAIIVFVYFNTFIYATPIVALIGGVIATNIKLHNIKKEYIELLDSKLSIYMSSLATAMETFSNTNDALKSIMPTLEEPIRSDVQEAMVYLSDGKDVRTAFKKMSAKYPQKELRHFNDQLDVIVKGGRSQHDTLRNLSFKMKKKTTYRRKLKSAHRAEFKVWKTFLFLTLSVPFLFIFVSWDNYLIIMNSLAINIVFVLAFLLIMVSYRKLEQLEIYDPTNDGDINL